jgi:hypothetical protein
MRIAVFALAFVLIRTISQRGVMLTLSFDHSSKASVLLTDVHPASSALSDAVAKTPEVTHTGKYYKGALVSELLDALSPTGDCARIVLGEEATDAQKTAWKTFVGRLGTGDIVCVDRQNPGHVSDMLAVSHERRRRDVGVLVV